MKIALEFALVAAVLVLLGCRGPRYRRTPENVELPRYMGAWYVWTGRTTFLEKGAHNALEKYSWNAEKRRIDVDFTFRKDAVNGKLKSLPQKAWIVEGTGNAHWKVQPFWPLKFDYIIVALGPRYEWTAVGVPNGKYLWIMGREAAVSEGKLAEVIAAVAKTGYPVDNLTRVPQSW